MGKLRSAIDALAALDLDDLDNTTLGELIVERAASTPGSTASAIGWSASTTGAWRGKPTARGRRSSGWPTAAA